ncbi:MAG: DeoR/GlpR family DNA-binding transcription regulator [Azospirillaceae bacterium]
MIPAQRRARILEIVRADGGASIDSLAEGIGASTSTVRRDLQFLADQGYLERSRGGATVRTLPRTTFEPDHEIGSAVAHGAKVAIGAVAAARIEPGQSVILDSSSTVLEAARWLVERGISLTAVTNDLRIGEVMADAPGRLIVVGGTLRQRSRTLVGDPGLSFLQGLRADVALLGIHAMGDGRLSETSVELATMKRAMIAAARRRILLVDSSKFDDVAFASVVPDTGVDEVILDSGASPADLARLEQAGLTVTVAPLEPG